MIGRVMRAINHPITILVLGLFLIAACEPSKVVEDTSSGSGIEFSTGWVYMVDPPKPSIQLDFSGPEYSESNDQVLDIDLSFDGSVLKAQYGIADLGSYPACFNVSRNAISFPIEEERYFETRLLEYGVTAPENGYARTATLDRYMGSCQLFAVRTAEGHYGLFLHVETVVGAYDRLLFFWIYRTDGERVFLSTDPARLEKGYVYALAWSPDGKTLAQASNAGIYLDDTETFKQRSYIKTDIEVRSLAFHPKKNMLAWGGCDAIVRLVDVSTSDLMLSLDGHNGCVRQIAFSPTGSIIATGTSDGIIRVWDTETGRSYHEVVGLEGHELVDMTFTEDERTLAAVFRNSYRRYDTRTLRVWDAMTGELVLDTINLDPDDLIDAVTEYSPSFDPHPTAGLMLSPDGRRLAAFNYTGLVWLWNVSTGQLLNAVQAELDHVRNIALNYAGSIIAFGNASGEIILHEVETGLEVQLLENGLGRVANLTFSPEGDMLTSGAGLVSLWDVESGRLLGNLK